jgi:hypothetical protein
MDRQNCGGKNTQYYPCYSESNNDLLRWKAKGRPEMLQPKSQYRLKRRSGWFWVTVCVLASIFTLTSSGVPLSYSWVPSFLDKFSSLVSRSGSTSPDVHSSDPKILQATASHQVFNRTDQVQFDKYSLVLRGQRILLQYVNLPLVYIAPRSQLTPLISSGEFHTFRLPVPSLWPDILQKIKAAGLNAISVYTHMGLINPSRGVIDFNGFRALQPLYDAARDAGIWIVLRPGTSVSYFSID